MSLTMEQAALDYAADGWAVLPIVPGDKKPACVNGLKDATTDPDEIHQAWGAEPDMGIGIACGAASHGLCIIDFDVHEEKGIDGLDSLREWEKEHGDLPETVTAISGSGGYHMYYRVSDTVKPSVNGEIGVDIRADGSYIIAPPTLHPSGGRYEWENPPDEYPVAWADDNVLGFIESIRPKNFGGSEWHRFEMPEKVSEGGRNNTLAKLACSYQAKSLDDSAIYDLVRGANLRCEPPLPPDEVDEIVANILRQYPKGHSKEYEEKKPAITYELDYDTARNIKRHLMAGENGCTVVNTYNAVEVLNRDPNLKGRAFYDTRAYTVMVQDLPWDKGSEPRPVRDDDYVGLARYGDVHYRMGNKAKWTDALNYVARRNERNLVAEWLDSLEWDGVPRIGTMFSVFLGAEMNDYTMAVSRLLMLGGAARAYSPGCKFDYVPVLEGRQGLGKSVFTKMLAVRPEWFGDSFNSFTGDAAVEKLRGIWFGEVAELLALKRTREIEGVKAFITTTHDTIRPKYARETEQRPRACVLIGTTNDPAFLTDTTGNRRWLPIKCGVIEPTMSMWTQEARDYFEQAWAEAAHIWKTEDPTLVLPPELESVAIEMQECYTEDDPRVGIIQTVLDSHAAAAAQRGAARDEVRVCARWLVDHALPDDYVKDAGTKRGTNELHAIMRNLVEGWEPWPYSKRGQAECGTYGKQKCYIPTAEAWGKLRFDTGLE